mgnify:CR=1 FL=1
MKERTAAVRTVAFWSRQYGLLCCGIFVSLVVPILMSTHWVMVHLRTSWKNTFRGTHGLHFMPRCALNMMNRIGFL